MKNFVIIANSILLARSLIAAWPSPEELALYNARQHGAEAQERLRVVDSEGRPVAGARVWGGLQTGDELNDYIEIKGLTNTNGEFVICGKCTNRIRCEITKEGYYDSEFVAADYGYAHDLKDGKWQPYGKQTKVVLKKIIDPVVAGVRYIEQKIPSFGTWMGYDLEKVDWVSPFGRGDKSDVMVRFSARESGPFDFGYRMELSFTHFPFAGVLRCKKEPFTRFPYAYHADTNALYQGEIEFEVDRSGAKKVWKQLGEDEYLIFRTRTRIDSNGKLISAHYGRIDGEWKFYELHTMQIGGVYFNGMSNDTNLEDEHSFKDALRKIRRSSKR